MGKLRRSEKLTPGKKFCGLFLADPVEWAPGLGQRPSSSTSFCPVTLSRVFTLPDPYFSYIKSGPEVFNPFHLQRLRRGGECGRQAGFQRTGFRDVGAPGGPGLGTASQSPSSAGSGVVGGARTGSGHDFCSWVCYSRVTRSFIRLNLHFLIH